MKATFFIISSTVGQPGVMSVSDLNTLKASGMEIGAHTVFHRDLQNLTSDEAKRELCLSRNWLMDRGFDVYDMAYPYDSTNASVKQLVAACGYNGARSGGQLQCDANHACSETVPPLDTYSIRTPNALETTTTLADMKAMVTNAENGGGGWVPLEIHDICDGPNDPLLPAGAPCYAPGMVTRALFNQFLDWVKGEVDAGRVQVKTVHEVVGGALQPQTPVARGSGAHGQPAPEPVVRAARHGHHAGRLLGNINNGPDHPPVVTTTNDAHAGSKALAINVPANYDSWAYNMIAPVLDLAQCSPTAVRRSRLHVLGLVQGQRPDQDRRLLAQRRQLLAAHQLGPGRQRDVPGGRQLDERQLLVRGPGRSHRCQRRLLRRRHVRDPDGRQQLHDRRHEPGRRRRRTPADYALSVSSAGAGTGTVTSNPAGIDCGATCAADFTDGTSVTLTAAAAAGSGFTGWSGACIGRLHHLHRRDEPGPLGHGDVRAAAGSAQRRHGGRRHRLGHEPGRHRLRRDVPGHASPTARASRSRAAAAAGSTFTGWSGACTGAAATCTVAMNAAKSVTATFALLPVQLTVAKTGTGTGSVTSPAGIDCGATCQVTFANGTSVTLTAAPASARPSRAGAVPARAPRPPASSR